MDTDKGFSHISLSADEEDDIVIQAGAVDASPSVDIDEASLDELEEAGAAKGTEEEGAEDDQSGASAVAAASVGLVDLAANEEEREEYLRHMRRQQARRAASEMATTEEDLRAKTPFSHMRIAIVVSGILLVAVALVYWFFLR